MRLKQDKPSWDMPKSSLGAFEKRPGLMSDREVTERENRRLITRLKFASLRQDAVVENNDLRTRSSIVRAFFAKLEEVRPCPAHPYFRPRSF